MDRLDEIAELLGALPRRIDDGATFLRAGALIAEAKQLLGHGHLLNWLKGSVGLSPRTARRFSKAYEWFDRKGQRKRPLETNGRFEVETTATPPPMPLWAQDAKRRISVSALCYLSRPKVPEALRRRVIELANGGRFIDKADAELLFEVWRNESISIEKREARQLAKNTRRRNERSQTRLLNP